MPSFPEDRSNIPRTQWMSNTAVYNYLPLEFYRNLSTDISIQNTPSADQPEPTLDDELTARTLAWHGLVLTLLLGLIGTAILTAVPQVTAAVLTQTKEEVAELGLPLQWKF
jgi:hypothetical protein